MVSRIRYWLMTHHRVGRPLKVMGWLQLLSCVAVGTAPDAAASTNAVVALVLAIVSWVVCPVIPAVVALVLARSATTEIDASGGRVTGRGLVTAARVVAWVNIGLYGAGLVLLAFLMLITYVPFITLALPRLLGL